MSTRSSIAVVHPDGSVSAVYCHFDGYLEGVGEALLKNHNARAKAEKLVALGDLSCVDINGPVEAYSRDRGEAFKDVQPRKYASVDEYKKKVGDDIGDNGYRYLFSGGAWRVWDDGERIRHVTAALKKERAE